MAATMAKAGEEIRKFKKAFQTNLQILAENGWFMNTCTRLPEFTP